MDAQRDSAALGGFLLGLTLCVAFTVMPRNSVGIPDTPAPRPSDLGDAVSLGWPIPASCGEPSVWDALPRVGPARASALATAAGRGTLQRSSDLLRVPGIGPKMTALLTPRVAFPVDDAAAGSAEEPP